MKMNFCSCCQAQNNMVNQLIIVNFAELLMQAGSCAHVSTAEYGRCG